VSKLAKFRPATVNANRHTQRGLKALEQSIREDGYVAPITVAADGEALDGSARMEVVADLLDVEPLIVEHDGTRPVVMVRKDIPNAQTDIAKRIAVRANRVGQIDLEWDAEVLAEMPESVLGELWNEDELKDLFGDIAAEPKDDPGAQTDKAEELREKWGVQSGQLWQLGEHRLVCGDCTDKATVERVMGGERAQAVVTDPPYGQDQEGVPGDEPENLLSTVQAAIAVLPVENTIMVVFQSPRTFTAWLDAARGAGHTFERMLWLYKAAQCTFPWRGWILTSESIPVFSVGNADWQDAHPYAHDCYYLSEVSGELAKDSGWHGSVKPLSVVSDIVQRVSASGATVFDGFLGSGTTLIACERLGRKCRAVEISPAYCAVAIQRWVDMTGGEPVLVSN
jgi:DNA modification methylase